MGYSIAVCDHNAERKKCLIEMLHVFENEFGRSLNITEYTDEEEFIASLDDTYYQIVFFNILQAGLPSDLDYAQDIHRKNLGTLFMSLCPKERYMYYRDVAQEFSSFTEPIHYEKLKKELMKAIKCIDCKGNQEDIEKKYIKVKLKRKIDFIEVERITYVEKKEFGVVIHTLDREYCSFEDCIELYKELEKRPKQFVETEENYIINFNLLYDLEKLERVGKRWGKGKENFFAVMTGYAHVPVNKAFYDSLFKRFVNEILRREKFS